VIAKPGMRKARKKRNNAERQVGMNLTESLITGRVQNPFENDNLWEKITTLKQETGPQKGGKFTLKVFNLKRLRTY